MRRLVNGPPSRFANLPKFALIFAVFERFAQILPQFAVIYGAHRWGPVVRGSKAATMDMRVDFHKRVGSLQRQHKAMANGYTTQLREDGLIVMKPKRGRRRGFPLRALTLLFLGFFAFKGFMLASLGDVTYNERVAQLSNGSPVEQAGAWVMQGDPVTVLFAEVIKDFG